MRLGLFTPAFGTLTFEELLAQLAQYPQITRLEVGCGGWPGSGHVNVDALLASQHSVQEYRRRLDGAGLSISALSCHGNPVHPNEAIARRDDAVFQKTLQLAERLEVGTVVTFSGCPGGAPGDVTPNWITAAWPPEYSDALEWQWTEKLVPYWRASERRATELGVRIALEAHPGFNVYNPETLLRLRNATGKNLGINLDPSHLWWQGIDIPSAINVLGEAIFHVHAKDVALHPEQVARYGVLDTKSYANMRERSWLFRSVGWGHDELQWKAIVSALRLAGYDDTLSIEHEDALASIHEGLSSAIALLSRVLLKEPPAAAWWT